LLPYFGGEVNTGIHVFRIFNISIVDVIVTIIGALLIAFVFDIKIMHSMIGVFASGIFFHRLFCIPTGVDVLLFGKN
jgi:hypothetical protein